MNFWVVVVMVLMLLIFWLGLLVMGLGLRESLLVSRDARTYYIVLRN